MKLETARAGCPPRDGFRTLLDGYLDEAETASMAEHIEGCADCQRLLDTLTGDGRIGRRPPPAAALQFVPEEDFLRGLRLAPPAFDCAGPPLPQIPGYQTLRRLGSGGMGVVYLARQTGLNRLIALKLVRAAAGDDVRRRFRREAEAVARLHHPLIVQIHEIGEYEGSPYLVLEFVDGVGLDRWSADRKPEPMAAAGIVAEVAGAIHAAHRAGIIHRDLKPANVLMAADGTPRVTDFGLAKLMDGDDAATRSGQLLGTPGYAAPEQIAGISRAGEITPATDVYALGAILYELLAGRPPFRADHPVDTLLQVLHTDPVPPSKWRPAVPRDLETICLACLNKSPAKRYASAEALADDLERFRAGKPVKARPLGAVGIALRWMRRHPAATTLTAAAVFAAFATTAGFAYLWREAEHRAAVESDAGRAATHRAADLAIDRHLTQCEQGNIAAGVRGLRQILAELPPGEIDLERVARDNIAAWSPFEIPRLRLWPHPAPVRFALFSPDGSRVVSVDGSGTGRLWNAETGEKIGRDFGGDGEVRRVVFRPDGRAVATATRKGLVRPWDTRTGEPSGPPCQADDGLNAIAYSPDGRTLWTAGKSGNVRGWNADTGAERLLFPHGTAVESVAVSADGTQVLTGGQDGQARLWNAADGTPLGTVARHRTAVQHVAFPPVGPGYASGSATDLAGSLAPLTKGTKPRILFTGSAVTALAYDSTGEFLVVGGGTSELRRGLAIHDLTHRQVIARSFGFESEIRSVDVTAGGRRILGAGNHWRASLWLEPFEVSMLLRLEHSGPVSAVGFSPDGRRILSASSTADDARGEVSLWQAPGDPEGPASAEVRITAEPERGDWTLKDERIYRAGRTEPEPIELPSAARLLVPDPSGSLLAVGCADNSIHLWDDAGHRYRGAPILLPEQLVQVAWHPDGRLLATRTLDGKARLWDAATGKPVGPNILWRAEGIRFPRDGRSLAVAVEGGRERFWRLP